MIGARTRRRLSGFVHATTPNEPTFIRHSRVFAHEAGHVLGLSHPFNGYQCVDDECRERRLYGTDDTFFTWSGVFVHGP
jgi:hypothetical protein